MMCPMAADPKDKLVLIVDDDPDICDLVALLVKTAGFPIVTAANGEQAIALLEKRPTAVVMDLIMPGCGGLGVLKHLKTLPQAIPVIAITAFQSSHPTVLEAAKDPLVKKCLRKPIDHEELLAALHAITGTQPNKR
jgi:CheY-like chemotaxis protein